MWGLDMVGLLMNGCLASVGGLQGCTVGDSVTWVGAGCQWFGAWW